MFKDVFIIAKGAEKERKRNAKDQQSLAPDMLEDYSQ